MGVSFHKYELMADDRPNYEMGEPDFDDDVSEGAGQ